MRISSQTMHLWALVPILAVLSGCGSTTVLPDPPKDPFPSPPMACLKDHPEFISVEGDEYLTLEDVEKAREELRRKSEDGEQYHGLWLDYRACREWLEKQISAS
jgi:hypothetical protein